MEGRTTPGYWVDKNLSFLKTCQPGKNPRASTKLHLESAIPQTRKFRNIAWEEPHGPIAISCETDLGVLVYAGLFLQNVPLSPYYKKAFFVFVRFPDSCYPYCNLLICREDIRYMTAPATPIA